MDRINPLQLPEILLTVAGFLPGHDLTQCLRVSKEWHQSLLPLLWKKIKIKGENKKHDPDTMCLDSLRRHRELICNLEVSHLHSEKYAWTYPKLHSMKLSLNFPSSSVVTTACHSAPEDDPVDIVDRNPSLVNLSIVRLKGYFHAPFWEAVSRLRHLTTLRLQYVNIVPTDAFWAACRNLEQLHMISTTFVVDNHFCVPEQSFPRMQSLSISNVRFFKHMEELKMIRQCQQLKDLVWRSRCSSQGVQEFIQGLVQGLWPNLESFDPGFNIPDQSVNQILCGMKRITKLYLTRTKFGPIVFQTLRHHFNTLVVFDHRGGSGPTSEMLREIMCSCPNLSELRGDYIVANEVVQDNPWVCSSLKFLQVCFRFEGSKPNIQQMIFVRLSGLTQLEEFQFGGWSAGPTLGFQEGLDLRLESGMGLLTSLKNIKLLNFYATTQIFGEDDVRWMISHWRRLERIVGCLTICPAERDGIVELLKGRGIKLC